MTIVKCTECGVDITGRRLCCDCAAECNEDMKAALSLLAEIYVWTRHRQTIWATKSRELLVKYRQLDG